MEMLLDQGGTGTWALRDRCKKTMDITIGANSQFV